MDQLPWLGPLLLQESASGRSAEEWLQLVTQVLARSAEAVGAFIIAVGVLRGLLHWAVSLARARAQVTETEGIRLGLGRTLGLALEFLLAADILNTAVAPSWDAIGKLAAIATIRTLLNYFLGQELRQEERRRAAADGPAGGAPEGRGGVIADARRVVRSSGGQEG